MKKAVLLVLLLALVVSSFAFKVIMVTDVGGLGDKSFNDGAWNGVLMAKEKYGIDAQVIQSKEQSDYVDNLSNAAKEADVVIAVGFMMSNALFDVAPQYPSTKFIGIDIAPPEGGNVPKNVQLYLFKEQESAFFVGYLAAAMTKTGKVGFIGGIAIPPVERFRYGYVAGVKTYNAIYGENVEIVVGYTESFTDAAKGKLMALAQFAEGADIIFAAAGACGNGVIDAAKEKSLSVYNVSADADLAKVIDAYYEKGEGYFAIGVDSDQDYMAPGYVLASAFKRVDNASYYGVRDAYRNRFKGGLEVLGALEDGVSLSPMKYTKGLVPARILAEIEYLNYAIKTGLLVVPDNENDLNNFTVDVEFPF
jgi:basic membrane protein A